MEALSEMEKRLQNTDHGPEVGSSEVNHLKNQLRSLQKDKTVCKVTCFPVTIHYSNAPSPMSSFNYPLLNAPSHGFPLTIHLLCRHLKEIS